MGQTCCPQNAAGIVPGVSHEELVKSIGILGDNAQLSAIVAGLTKIAEDYPYLKPTGSEHTPHPLLFFVRSCREHVIAGRVEEAQSCLDRVQTSLECERGQVSDAFKRFDVDGSGKLDTQEFLYMCAYIGWGDEEAKLMDKDHDSFVTLDEFQQFVGTMGGLQNLFQLRRQRVARKNWGTEAPASLEVGTRIKAFYKEADGKKSKSCKEGQILQLNVMPSNGVMIDFGFNTDDGKSAHERRVIPQAWIFNDARDTAVVDALREVGILKEQQAFWASIFPQSELRAVEKLVPCQRQALANVRAIATARHEAALPEVRDRFTRLGYSEKELQAVLGWVQDLAPMCVHFHVDRMGRFLEIDEYYRTQFETGTSSGALDGKNLTRKRWESDLFGGAYDECKPFERPKYGALGVMNDFRGVVSAYGYGDSYLVLKDVRLRTSFAATDSGGISGNRLAVLDKYAHVLQEYSDNELRCLVDVALANTSLNDSLREQPQLLRGLSVDPTAEWLTFGFPDLAQKKGRYFFEVELLKGFSSPQVGLLSSKFIQAPQTAGFNNSGVGDDEHGWAADGQHSILWHNGKKLPWEKVWPTDAESVVVGVAVDIDKRMIWFSSNGKWDEKPAFGQDLIQKNLQFYPALSVKGRAAFNFGPKFKHQAPSTGGPFERWPGAGDGEVRVDCPSIGNERNVGIYKEIQIHGELSFKRNVQRLVVNRRFLEVAKSNRSWGFKVEGISAGSNCNGNYSRSGAKNGMPLYKSDDGSCEMYYQPSNNQWLIVKVAKEEENTKEETLAQAAHEKDSSIPPREGWSEGFEKLGMVAVDIFNASLEKSGLNAADRNALMTALGKHNSKGEKVVFRVTDTSSFTAEWEKLKEPPMDAESAWNLVVDGVKARLREKFGFAESTIVETEHPYAAYDHTWTKTVSVTDGQQININFAPRTSTYDYRTRFEIFGGGLSKSFAGPGSRVHVKTLNNGSEQAHGTIVGKVANGRWKVRIDGDEAEISGAFSTWVTEAPGRYCAAVVVEEQKVVKVTYGGGEKVGSEIAGFTLDHSNPLAPFTIAGFKQRGAAQRDGALVGWYVDVSALLREEHFQHLEGFGTCPSNLAEVAENLEEFERRLAAALNLTDITLTFTNGLEFQMLPQCRAHYKDGKMVSDEIYSFYSDTKVVTINGMQQNGPAYESGVRNGWLVNLDETFLVPSNQEALAELTKESILSNASQLTGLTNVTLVFEPVTAEPQQYLTGSGNYPDTWKKLTVPSNSATFTFTTDGDKGDIANSSNRWGIMALVTPSGAAAPTQENINTFLDAWVEETSVAFGSRTKISVEPDDWDESRLRAICTKHGWEFEWMTEDGERRRRIEGAARAKKRALKTSEGKAEESSAWWRLG